MRSEPPAPLLAAEVNALPERVRQYVHDLETRCDPAGDVQTIASLREQRDALVALLVQDGTGAPSPAAVDRARSLGAALRLWEHPVTCGADIDRRERIVHQLARAFDTFYSAGRATP